MNKILLIIISVLTIFTITGCTNKDLGSKSKLDIKDDQVSMKVKEDTLTSSSATFIITNHTDGSFSYGEPYHLEKKVDGTWYILEPDEELNFILPAYQLDAHLSIEKNYNWEYGYGKLDKGDYRLVISVFNEKEDIHIAAEFTIE